MLTEDLSPQPLTGLMTDLLRALLDPARGSELAGWS
jgi:hypothetical protein